MHWVLPTMHSEAAAAAAADSVLAAACRVLFSVLCVCLVAQALD